jgi:hypothetical protein
MKHLLNDMSEEEKNSIREQHSSVKKVINEQSQPNPQIGREAQSIDDWKKLCAIILSMVSGNDKIDYLIKSLPPQTKDYLIKTSNDMRTTADKNIGNLKNNLGIKDTFSKPETEFKL